MTDSFVPFDDNVDLKRLVEFEPMYRQIIYSMYALPHTMEKCSWLDRNACPMHSNIFIEEDPV